MLAQTFADRSRISGDDVEDAFGHAGLLSEGRGRKRRERRHAGWLQHHRAACGGRAGHTLRVIIELGKFHGVMAPRQLSDAREARQGLGAMLGVVKPLGEDDEALMEPGRKLSHMRSDTLHSLSATLGVVKLLGEDDEALMEGGRKPCHA